MRLSDLTIVLPTRDEARNIPGFLASVPADVHLVVVDDSEDETPTLIESSRPCRTRVIRQASTVTEARQIGALVASTAWLLFTDADVSFAPDYFQRVTIERRSHAVYGPKLSRDAYAGYYRLMTHCQRFLQRLGIPAASGSNLLIQRSALMAVGGFDLRLTCNEDSEIAWRLARRGFKVEFDPELVVFARDHRRLQGGVLRKTVHSLTRCALIYLNLLPDRWRRSDWGYWAHRARRKPVRETSRGG